MMVSLFPSSKSAKHVKTIHTGQIVPIGSYALNKYGAENITLTQLAQAEALGDWVDKTGLAEAPADSQVIPFVKPKKYLKIYPKEDTKRTR